MPPKEIDPPMSDPTTNDQGVSLAGITRDAFKAYNAGGPPERANLTHDGRPVPGFEAVGPSVQHKWTVASSTAARAGAEYIIGLVAVGQHDPAKLRAAMVAVLAAPAWVPTIAYDAEQLAKAYDTKAPDGRALAMARTLREVCALPDVGGHPAAFFAAGLRALAGRDAGDDKAKARAATIAEWLEAWPSKEDVPLVGAVDVWRAITAGLQVAHDRSPPDARGRYAAMIDTYRSEADYLASLLP